MDIDLYNEILKQIYADEFEKEKQETQDAIYREAKEREAREKE